MAFDPTPEQQACVDAFKAHDGDLAITAGAGSGKTSTLKLLAAAHPNARGLYLAFNKAIAGEAQASFPGRVTAKTSHAVAFAAVGRQYAHRLGAKRPTGRQQADILGITGPHRVSDDKVLAPAQVARIVMQTVARFCYSADEQPGRHHVPRDVPGIVGIPEAQRRLEQIVEPFARKAWVDLTRTDGKLRFTHDCYLKIWAASHPRIDADYLLLDEAQDTNEALWGVVREQDHLLRILVGDPCQMIYAWRGSRNVMRELNARYELTLSKSFRFGQEIADEANKWLTVLDADLRITGHGHSEVRPLGDATPDAVLCRTNAEAVATLIRLHGAGVRAGLVGGGKELVDFANAVDDLRDKGWTSHPELAAFASWPQVCEYVEQDFGGEDFSVAVKLVETYGTDGVRSAIENSTDERHADTVISTAHKSKGREWATVRIADDFPEPKPTENGDPGKIARPDAMLAYVAVTRAKKVLDRGGLAFVDRYLPGDYWEQHGLEPPAGRTCARVPFGDALRRTLEPGSAAHARAPQSAPTRAHTRGPYDERAAFEYTVTDVHGALITCTTDFVWARDARDTHPGATLDSRALNAFQEAASA